MKYVSLAVVIATSLAAVSQCDAYDVDKAKLLEFISGKWEATYEGRDDKTVATYQLAPGGKVLLHEGKTSDGTAVAGLIAFEADTMVHTAYQSDGDYQRIEYTDFEEDAFTGTASGIANGQPFKGRKIRVQRINDNEVHATFSGGELPDVTAILKRVTKAE